MFKTITVTLLLFATPAMAQYVPYGQQGPSSFGSPPPPPPPPPLTCTQTCIPLGNGMSHCTTTCR
jgi:hypothetical protein